MKKPRAAGNAKAVRANDRDAAGTLLERITQYLEDGTARRYTEIADAVGKPAIGGELKRLEKAGAVTKVARGVYAKSGIDAASGDPGRPRLGPAQAKVYGLLDQPKSAVELKSLLGVSAQAVDQLLKALIARGLVERIRVIGERGGYIYLRADDRDSFAPEGRAPLLRESAARVLSAVPPEAPALVTHVVGSGPDAATNRRVLQTLESQGLVAFTGIGHLQLVALTDRGRQHPAYDGDAPKALGLPKPPRANTPELRVLLALDALGRARARDLLLVVGIDRSRPGGEARVRTYLDGFARDGLVEPVVSGAERDPVYRVSMAGLALIETLRGRIAFPQPAALAKLLAVERADDPESLETLARDARRGDRPSFILQLLRERGPLPTSSINALLPRPYSDNTSLGLALNNLAKRGIVLRQPSEGDGRGTLIWSAPDAGGSDDEG